jgi:hypothetical protein
MRLTHGHQRAQYSRHAVRRTSKVVSGAFPMSAVVRASVINCIEFG